MGRPAKTLADFTRKKRRAWQTAMWILTGKGEPAPEHVELLKNGTWRKR
jgi:hypothetical protein